MKEGNIIMDRKVQLDRDELVWQRRTNSWGAEDYAKFLDYLKEFEGTDAVGYRKSYNSQVYEVLKNYSWDQMCDIIDGVLGDPKVCIHYRLNKDDEVEYSYEEYLSNIICDAIREDNYECDVSDETYADDYEEKWLVLPLREKETIEEDE